MKDHRLYYAVAGIIIVIVIFAVIMSILPDERQSNITGTHFDEFEIKPNYFIQVASTGYLRNFTADSIYWKDRMHIQLFNKGETVPHIDIALNGGRIIVTHTKK